MIILKISLSNFWMCNTAPLTIVTLLYLTPPELTARSAYLLATSLTCLYSRHGITIPSFWKLQTSVQVLKEDFFPHIISGLTVVFWPSCEGYVERRNEHTPHVVCFAVRLGFSFLQWGVGAASQWRPDVCIFSQLLVPWFHMVAWRGSWGPYLYHGNRYMLQIRVLPTPSGPKNRLLNICQHTTVLICPCFLSQVIMVALYLDSRL